ncbi:MAG: cobalamin biosynthesis protein CbiG [Epsilonproteobacteria bacterium]|nr:cobalamin biosynthesis protein CbiG [Campylobacterota bacterium]
MKIAIISINRPSLESSIELKEYLKDYNPTIYTKEGLIVQKDIVKFKKLDDILPNIWKEYDAIIAILAVGAVVRKIAPLLKSKESDPAVLVINLKLDRVLPLLSGHLGGANELADIISKRVPNCLNFISTATDQTDTLAFDMLAKERGWRIENIKELAKISNRLINREVVKVATYETIFNSIENRENLKLIDFKDIDRDSVVISPTIRSNRLTLTPKVYIGIGCNRGTSRDVIEKSFELFIQTYNIRPDDIVTVGSFDAKRDEKGLLEFAKGYNFKMEFFKKDDINSLEKEFTKSASTKFFGLKGVAEPSAVLASEYRELVIKKKVYFNAVTIALAV